MTKKYRVDVQGINENVWSNNNLIFDTSEEAISYAKDLYSRWFGMSSYRIVPVDTPRNEIVIEEHKTKVIE